jgi:hypothetical protein
MKLRRPYIPLYIRCMVACRQLCEIGRLDAVLEIANKDVYSGKGLSAMLFALFGDQPAHLDHDPPLCLRHFDEATGLYVPDANNPAHLIYRTAEDHKVKTFVRGDHGQFSDAQLRRRALKRQHKETNKEPSRGTRWPSRPLRSASHWPPKGSRPMRGRARP